MNIQLSRMYFQNVEIKRTIDALYCGVLLLQSNLDYPDSLGLHEIVRIIEGPDNREYEY